MDDKKNENILGYFITTKSTKDCIREIIYWVQNNAQGKYLVCANPHSIETARKDPLFDKALRNADLVVPDGIGILIASKLLGGNIQERITGSDIFFELSRSLDQIKKKYRYFFLGSTNGNLSRIREKMEIDFPNIEIAGTYAPPYKPEFSEEENRRMVEFVNSARADVLWVGMTAPKQERWIYQNRDKLEVKFIAAIGAVFDFYTGKVKRSHPFFQKVGLEWFPRFFREPLRLWRRNLISNPCFLLRVVHCKWKNS